MDCIAKEIGVKPSLSRLFLHDPWLSVRCFFGACVPAQYRLQGPGQWSGAKGAITRCLANNATATRTRLVPGRRLTSTYNILTEVLLPIVFGFLFMVFLYYCGILPFCL